MLLARWNGTHVRFETPSLRAGWNTCEDLILALEAKGVVVNLTDQETLAGHWARSFSGQEVISTREALLLCFEALALAEVLGQEPAELHLAVVETFLRKFEISRKLYSSYQSKTFAVTSKESLLKKEYALLSAMLFQTYRLTGDLRLLSAILKNRSTPPFIRSRVDQIIAAL